MIEWQRDLPSARDMGSPHEASLSAWPDGGFSEECQHLRYCPVGASELLVVAQMLPLEVIRTTQGPQLVAALNPSQLKPLAFTEEGVWKFSYKPVALRMLPFLTFADGSTGRIAPVEAYPDVTRGQELQDTMGRIIRLGARDMQRLSALVARAFEAGFLSWPEEGDVAQKAPRWLLSPDDLRLRPDEIAPYRILAAMEFSKNQSARVQPLSSRRHRRAKNSQAEPEEALPFLSFDTGLFFE